MCQVWASLISWDPVSNNYDQPYFIPPSQSPTSVFVLRVQLLCVAPAAFQALKTRMQLVMSGFELHRSKPKKLPKVSFSWVVEVSNLEVLKVAGNPHFQFCPSCVKTLVLASNFAPFEDPLCSFRASGSGNPIRSRCIWLCFFAVLRMRSSACPFSNVCYSGAVFKAAMTGKWVG